MITLLWKRVYTIGEVRWLQKLIQLTSRSISGRRDEAENKDDRIRFLKKACEIAGKGDFLQNLSGEEWVIMESARYMNLYGDALQEVCDHLIEKKEYEEALKMVEPACELYPLDEWQTVRMECYMGMGRYNDALREYDETAQLLSEELGISPSDKMQKLLTQMNKRMVNKPQVISEIKNNLHEEERTEGAFIVVSEFSDDSGCSADEGSEAASQIILCWCPSPMEKAIG